MSNFHENFDRQDFVLPPDRSTGLVFAAVALFIAYALRAHTAMMVVALVAAAALAAVSLTVPHVMRPLNVVWMRFAQLLSRIVNPIVMFILFAVVIVPAGIFMQLKRDPLRRNRSGENSYWIARDPEQSSMSNQF